MRHLGKVSDARPPFAPSRARFAFVGLAAAAARAPLGGPREALLGALMVARLASGLHGPHPLTTDARRARATGVKSWLTALAVPAKLRSVLQRAIQASAEDTPTGVADAVDAVTEVTAPHLDRAARSELTRLTQALRAASAPLAGVVHRPVE